MAKLESYIWFEKYRPATFKDMSLDKKHKVAFTQFVKDGQIPHLLLNGPRGSGKTTIAKILMDTIPCITLRLNASGKEDRSMETMQTRVKQFAASMPPKGKIKIVFLDEADGLLSPAQESLQNTLETYNKSCRFIMTCNHVDKIIDTIQSRCMRFDFGRFPKRKVLRLCEDILAKEGIEDTSRDDLSILINRFYPDVRSVINNLQAACVSGRFDIEAIGALSIDPNKVGDAISKGHVLTMRQALAGITNFQFLYKYLIDEFVENNGTDEQKADMIIAIADALAQDGQVPDREINFVSCVLMLMQALEIQPDFSK